MKDYREVLIAPVVSEKSYSMLDQNKYTFIVAPSANKTEIKIAVEKVENNVYDLILMDIQMPNMNGIEAAQKIRNNSNVSMQSIPIIALEPVPEENSG